MLVVIWQATLATQNPQQTPPVSMPTAHAVKRRDFRTGQATAAADISHHAQTLQSPCRLTGSSSGCRCRTGRLRPAWMSSGKADSCSDMWMRHSRRCGSAPAGRDSRRFDRAVQPEDIASGTFQKTCASVARRYIQAAASLDQFSPAHHPVDYGRQPALQQLRRL